MQQLRKYVSNLQELILADSRREYFYEMLAIFGRASQICGAL